MRAMWPGAASPPRRRSRTDRELLFASNAFSIPGGELAVSYPVPARDGDLRPGKRDYNIVWYRPTDAAALADLNTDASGRRHEQIPPPLIRPDVIAAVKADARALLAPSIADIFVRAEQPIFQPIHDFASPQLVFGRIALLGDAAFVARPHVGAGVTKAALDAMCLADALADTTTHRCGARATTIGCGNAPAAGRCPARANSARASAPRCRATGCRPPQEAQRSERVFREYAELHAEVREWSKDAFESEAFRSDAFRSSESSRPR